MRSARIFSLGLTLAASSLFAQSFTLPPHLDPSRCPVGLEVEQNGSLVAYKNAKSGLENDSRSWQRFDFKMTNPFPHEIEKVQITAHGFSYKWRAFSVPLANPDLEKTVDVAFEVQGNGSASRELSFDHLPIVTTFDIDAVTYADGSAWHASSAGACSVAPSPIVRIDAR